MNEALLAADACGLAATFARGEATPTELVSACVAEIRRRDPLICAFNALASEHDLFSQAQESTQRYREGTPLSPLDGIPFAVKANIAIKALPWHAGIGAFAKRRAETDAACVRTLRQAGMIPFGITNMHEAALGVTTNNHAFGRTRNPRNSDHIPGGSSGGSAAAVAASLVPIALGTDDMGSVRLPSALCGIVGYKPAFGTISNDGLIPLAERLDHIGVHARSVRDVRAVMRLFGESQAPSDEQPSPAALVHSQSLHVEARVERAFRGVLDRIHCREALDWRAIDLSSWRRAGLLVCERDLAHRFSQELAHNPHGFSDEFRALINWAERAPAEKFEEADTLVEQGSERLLQALAGAIILSPTMPVTAPKVDAPVPNDLPNLCLSANFAGVPSISLPIPEAGQGLPVGLLISGSCAGDVLRLAESVCPDVVAPAHA